MSGVDNVIQIIPNSAKKGVIYYYKQQKTGQILVEWIVADCLALIEETEDGETFRMLEYQFLDFDGMADEYSRNLGLCTKEIFLKDMERFQLEAETEWNKRFKGKEE